MKFGVREICDVVIRAKSRHTIGTRTFEAFEPVMYFDTAKTSSLEGAATTVYATGGSGNSRLIAWEGERTVTFTLEDALMSPLGFSILSGANVVDATSEKAINVHSTAKVSVEVTDGAGSADLAEALEELGGTLVTSDIFVFILDQNGDIAEKATAVNVTDKKVTFSTASTNNGLAIPVLVDFYVSKTQGVQQLEVTPDKFAGNYYLEASTLFRRQSDGKDLPAQFIIPNVKIQSNFTFSMAASGDPSTFTFTMDAFPDYIKGNNKKKVMFALQILNDEA